MINNVFVYGTLRSGMENYSLISNYVIKKEKGVAIGILYHLKYGYPAMVQGEGSVIGELLTFKAINDVLPLLDRLEGYYGKNNTRNLYTRKVVIIRTQTKKIPAYTYYWNNHKEINKIGEKIPSGDWIKYLNAK